MDADALTLLVRGLARVHLFGNAPPPYVSGEYRAERRLGGLFRVGVARFDCAPFGEYSFDLDLHERLSYNGYLWVHPGLRGRGLGHCLVSFREAVCLEAGVEAVLISTNGNAPFWERMGYEMFDEQVVLPGFVEADRVIPSMIKYL
ncbi:GNAT family N-acetyltransferase [Candidatus Woesearchaeota archaeon]|nr:GNAT family N-acetyltransferase [Candidatus Woesearchaeota archaeon]